MKDCPPKKPKRRWYQFRLRTLLLSFVPIGLCSMLLGNAIAEYDEEQRAVAAIGNLPRSRDPVVARGIYPLM